MEVNEWQKVDVAVRNQKGNNKVIISYIYFLDFNPFPIVPYRFKTHFH